MRAVRRLRFQAKVLIPVLTIMVLLLGFITWMVNRQFTEQLRIEASQRLSTANAVFEHSQAMRRRNVLARYQTLANEPRVKSVSLLDDAATFDDFFKELFQEAGSDFALLTKKNGQKLTSVSRLAGLNVPALETNSALAVKVALEGHSDVDIARVGSRLFEIVSIPVKVGEDIVGALTFAEEIAQSLANELKQLTHSEIVFIADRQLVASTLRETAAHLQLLDLFYRSSKEVWSGSTPFQDLWSVVLDGEHFLGRPGYLSTHHGAIGYVILSSYEKALSQLRATQRTLLGVSLGGILLSTIIIWLLVRTVTQPLRELRDGAEAVGLGDFSRRVLVGSHDECGDLAKAFNQFWQNTGWVKPE